METSMFKLPLTSSLPDWAALATARIEGHERVLLTGRRDVLEEHLKALEDEFRGEPQLHYYHAALSVLIRRDIQRDLALAQFYSMWRDQPDCMLRLSTRWLISACDTLMAHSQDMADRTAGAAGSFIGNLVKLYETERHFSGVARAIDGPRGPVPLFDGLTTFSIGNGDMIMNQRRRFADLVQSGSFAHRIVATILERIDSNDTVFSRFAALHQNEATRWS